MYVNMSSGGHRTPVTAIFLVLEDFLKMTFISANFLGAQHLSSNYPDVFATSGIQR